jgi:hypothetical protein
MGCGLIKGKPVPLAEKLGTPLHTPMYNSGDWVIARASFHNHTNFSDGCRIPEDLVAQARNEGVSVLAITDHREGALAINGKKLVDSGGVGSEKTGFDQYFAKLEELRKSSSNPIIIPGIEVAPYFWNERSPKLLIRGDNRHFTVYGITDPKVVAEMPVSHGVTTKPQPDPGPEPYNQFVNYARDHGGMVFQAHPDWINPSDYGLGEAHSEAPTMLGAQLPRLTGVAVAPEGLFSAGSVGGEWDLGLMQYLAGYRSEPLWAWGEADFHCTDPKFPQSLRNSTTLVYLKDYASDQVYEAMSKGRMVALMGEMFQEAYVAEFAIAGKAVSGKVMLGESVKLSGPAVIRFALNKELPLQEARLIRNGKVIYTARSSSFEYTDAEAPRLGTPVYYRIQLIGDGPYEMDNANVLYTNPIFASWK